MNKELTKFNSKELNLQNKLEKVKLLFPHLSSISEREILKALSLCHYLELDPIKKEVHLVPFRNSVQLVVSYTEYLKRAERGGRLDGWTVDIGEDEKNGLYAEVIIKRKDWSKELKWKAYLKEAMPSFKDEKTKKKSLWYKMPLFMLRKVAIAQAFRFAFPEETQSLPYEEAELPLENQSSLPPNPEPNTPEPEIIDKKKVRELWITAREHNVSEQEVREIINRFGYKSTKEIKIEDYESILFQIKALAKPSEPEPEPEQEQETEEENSSIKDKLDEF